MGTRATLAIMMAALVVVVIIIAGLGRPGSPSVSQIARRGEVTADFLNREITILPSTGDEFVANGRVRSVVGFLDLGIARFGPFAALGCVVSAEVITIPFPRGEVVRIIGGHGGPEGKASQVST